MSQQAIPEGTKLFGPVPLTVTVVATDETGQTGSAQTEIDLYRCIPPAG